MTAYPPAIQPLLGVSHLGAQPLIARSPLARVTNFSLFPVCLPVFSSVEGSFINILFLTLSGITQL